MEPLHVMEVLEATAGGTRRHLRDLVQALDRRRFRLTVVVSVARDPDFSRDLDLFRKMGVTVELLPMIRQIAPLADVTAVARLTRLLRRRRPDIVHAHSSKAGMVARLAARRAGRIPVVYTPHAFAFLSDHSLRSLYLVCERWAARWTDRLIAVSREEHELACASRHGLALPRACVQLIPNGIASGDLPPPRSSTPPVVGFVGRLCRQKGPDFFLTVASRLHAAYPDAQFRMVGEGPWLPWVERQIERLGLGHCLTLRTARDDVAVGAELAELDLLVMPSRWEGLPYTLLEAMAAGVPVVAMAAGGIADVVEDGVSGMLSPVGDLDGLTLRMQLLLTDTALAQRLRIGAHQRLAQFTLRGMVDATAAVYEELADATSGARANSGYPS